MSVNAGELFEPLLDAAVKLCWRQWGAVASGSDAQDEARTIIDPEALLLASLALSEREPRLRELSEYFMYSLSSVLSVGRTNRLLRQAGHETASLMRYAASLAAHRGGDARWKKLASTTAPGLPMSLQFRQQMKPRYGRPAALVYRLRMGLGVGIKADLLAFLIGTGEWVSAREVASAIAWNGVAARRALEDLVLAGFIESSEPADWHPTRARQYRADASRWRDVARLGRHPARWGYHFERLGFVIRIHDWLSGPNAGQWWDDLELGNWARLWMEKYSAAFRFGALVPAEPRGTLEEIGAQFQTDLSRLAMWMATEG
jgi:hypothetical protein